MPFAPTDIAGLKHWIESDTGLYQDALLATPCTDATAVWTWKNNGSTAANFVQATAARQPMYYASGGSNNKPYVRFTDDWMQATVAGQGSPVTVFIVAKCLSTINSESPMLSDSTGVWELKCISTTVGSMYQGGTQPQYPLTGSTMLFTYIVRTAAPYSYYWNGRAAYPSVIGVNTGPTTLPANPVIGALSAYGTSYVWGGEYYAMLLYDTALSDANRALVVNYLATKYGTDLGAAAPGSWSDRPVILPRYTTVIPDASERLAVQVRKETTEGEAATPCLALDRLGPWRFRWGVKSGTRTISVKTKQVSNVNGQRPRLVVKAEPLLGVASDVTVDAANSAGWVTLGPASITPTSNGVVWVELWNMDNTSTEISPAFFDDITTT